MLAADHGVESIESAQVSDVELLAVGSLHAERANRVPRTQDEGPVYQEGDKVLVAYGAVFSGPK